MDGSVLCMAGDGIDALWKVNNGLGFQCVVTGLTIIANAIMAVNITRKSTGGYDSDGKSQQRANIRLGVFMGSACLCAVMSLQTAVLWGGQSTLLKDLDAHLGSDGGHFYEGSTTCTPHGTFNKCDTEPNCVWTKDGCQLVFDANTRLEPTLNAMVVFAVFTLILQGFLVFALRSAQKVMQFDSRPSSSLADSTGPQSFEGNYQSSGL